MFIYRIIGRKQSRKLTIQQAFQNSGPQKSVSAKIPFNIFITLRELRWILNNVACVSASGPRVATMGNI